MALEADIHIDFTKMTGSGNDFILIDNRNCLLDADKCRTLVRLACRRKLSVGADGLILIENDAEVDFKWRFFNADGSEAEMCGNGARCAARFAYLKGIVKKPQMAFRTLAGVIEAEIIGRKAKIKMTPPHSLEADFHVEGQSLLLNFVNTGVPHVVCLAESGDSLEETDIMQLGRTLRFHPHFQPAGTNVNFAFVLDRHQMAIRTYERGVEAETLACGTGSIASALICAEKRLVSSPVEVQTRSGEVLKVHFKGPHRESSHGKAHFDDVYLEGDAKLVYEAKLYEETISE